MKQHIENTRRQLGELGAMAHQTEAMERQILERAEARLAEVQGKIEPARVSALTGGELEQADYTELVMERGRLQQVIASARAALNPTN